MTRQHDGIGTRAFLFTDIEGSTSLWERFPQSMRASLERHDAILREAVRSAAGEIVKTTGDGLMAVFASTRDGVDASLRAQLALASEPWGEAGPLRVRMGLHTGEVARSGDDYVGPAVNRTARIMAAGHGGQVLLSGTAAALVMDDELPGRATLRDLGEHRLKDLGRPEHVFQLVIPTLPDVFPALATVDDRGSDLPAEPSAFVGRARELQEVEDLLRTGDVRVLTLLGPGGIGKTRLALRVAAQLTDVFGDGVHFVALEASRGADAVLVAIARAVGLPDAGEGTQFDELARRLRDRRCLLVLDNFEQVMDAAAMVAQLRDQCPSLHLLVTSRAALNIRGEHRYAVPPLELPAAADIHGSAEHLLGYEAVRFFVERAQAVRPDFALTDENAAAVAEICLRVDGLPLAIELATARIGLFSPEALRDRLRSGLTLLRSAARDLPERQQTLRAAIDWSYQLLEPGEQRLFELLSAFAGTQVEAVETVAGTLNGRLADVDALDALSSLVDKSLVRRVDDGGSEPRFVMLETIREFATERLDEQPGFGDDARDAHARYFADFILRQSEALNGTDRARALAAMTAEAENLRLCWRHWLDARDLDRLNSLVDGLWTFYDRNGWYRSTIELASGLLTLLDATPATAERAETELTLRMSQARALLAMEGYTSAVEEEFARALELFERARDRSQLFPVLRSLASFHTFRAEFDKTMEIGREIRELADRQDDASMRLHGDLLIGYALGFGGDLTAGADALDDAIAAFERREYRASRFQLGSDPRVQGLTTAAFFLWLLGRPDSALERGDRALELAAEMGHPSTRTHALFHTGLLHLWRREPELVRVRALGLMQVADENDIAVWLAIGTFLLGAASVELGDVEGGLSGIREGMDLYKEMRTPPVFWPMLLSVRAGACAGAGLAEEGLTCIEQALGIVGAGSGMPLLPELLLVKGDLLALAGDAGGENPATWYRTAYDTAHGLGARMSQLRAAIRLCRAARDPADAERARRDLDAVYGTFTEGFASADAGEARAALDA